MKIAISGKGGVGKTTISAILARTYAKRGVKVFAVDADPDSNLGFVLDVPDYQNIIPLIKMKTLIEERIGIKGEPLNTYFRLNPKVDDIPEKYFINHDGIKLAVMGTVKGGGTGCVCPENTFLRALIDHLILNRNEVVILDMEAGIEHLGRATARGINKLIIVVEPGRCSLDTAWKIKRLAEDIGIKDFCVVGNKIRKDEDKKFIADNLEGFQIIGFIPYNEKIQDANGISIPCLETYPEIFEIGEKIIGTL